MFISVIPSIKMPFGHFTFDYNLSQGSVHSGDIIWVPFRQKFIPALVSKISTTSEVEEKAIILPSPNKILKLPEYLPDFCIAAARESFVSPASMLHAWLRQVPKRAGSADETHTPVRDVHWPKDRPRFETRYVINRFNDPLGIITTAQAEQGSGRVLILTPWQKRAEYIAARLGCSAVHAMTADGAAWKAWTNFAQDTHSILATTKMGAWLACVADVVIMDEPENDDHKQDELSPRYDARRLIKLAADFNPALRIITICTTPPLSSRASAEGSGSIQNTKPDLSTPSDSAQDDINKLPDLEPEILFATFNHANRSNIESITAQAMNAIQEALEQSKPIRILHPVYGWRGRIRCSDCDWTLECPSCGTGMSNSKDLAACRRCNHKMPMPLECPKCRGANLTKSMIGAQALQQKFDQAFPGADIKVLDAHEWQFKSPPLNALVVLTNLSFIGGFSEDMRRKERLVIGFRRLVAQSCVAKSKLVVQGPEELVGQAPNWLTAEGLAKTWEIELKERAEFQFPPARQIVKLIIPGKEANMPEITQQIAQICEKFPGWSFRGPYPVEFRPKTREPREVFHLLPPESLSRDELIQCLEPFTAFGLIDLDPIAFFS